MSKKNAEDTPQKPRRPRRWRRRLGMLAIAATLFAVWLNGPGVRWIGGIALRKVLAKQNIAGDFKLRGSILSGLSLDEIHLRGGPVVKLDAETVGVSYRITEIIHGRARSLRIHGLVAVVDLDALPPAKEKEPEPFDPAALAEKIRKGVNTAYKFADPVDIDIRGLAVELRKGETPVFAIGPTSLAHAGHAEPYRFSLGEISHVLRENIPAQKFAIDWSPEHLRIEPFDPLPRLSLRDVDLATLEDENTPLVHLALGFEGRVIDIKISSDARDAELLFTGDPLSYSQIAKGLKLAPPADFDAELRTLSLRVEGIDKTLADWTAALDLAVGDIVWQEWKLDGAEFHLDQNLNNARAHWKLDALDGTVTGTATTDWPESAPLLEDPVPPKVEGTLKIAGLDKILASLGKHIELPKGDDPFPGRTLETDWSLDLAENQPVAAAAKLILAGGKKNPPPPVHIDADWDKTKGLAAHIQTAAVQLKATLDPDFAAYQGTLSIDENAAAALSPWIRAFTDAMPEGLVAAIQWHGSGDLKATPPLHKGSIELSRFHLPLPDQPPTDATAKLSYQYTDFQHLAADISALHATRDKFTLDLRGKLADQQFELAEFSAKEGKDPLVSGSGTIPLPENPADWKAMLSLEKPWNRKAGHPRQGHRPCHHRTRRLPRPPGNPRRTHRRGARNGRRR